jgi:hypothetical protein
LAADSSAQGLLVCVVGALRGRAEANIGSRQPDWNHDVRKKWSPPAIKEHDHARQRNRCRVDIETHTLEQGPQAVVRPLLAEAREIDVEFNHELPPGRAEVLAIT